MELTNYSITFYIYCLFSEDFRNTLLRTMKWPWFDQKTSIKRNDVGIYLGCIFSKYFLWRLFWDILRRMLTNILNILILFTQFRLTTTQPIITQHKLALTQQFPQHSTSGFVTGNGRSSSIWCPLLVTFNHEMSAV